MLDERVYNSVTGVALLCAAAILAFRRGRDGQADKITPFWGSVTVGAAVGLVSGLTGVGGGIFLAPILIAMGWASPKQTAALTAPFILANSLMGLIGARYAGQMPSAHTWLYAMAALVGAMLGTMIGLRWLTDKTTRFVLAAILATAGLQLLLLPHF
ncbi:putative membrane protein YfcA [Bradyrhizobium diazoefficiens]